MRASGVRLFRRHPQTAQVPSAAGRDGQHPRRQRRPACRTRRCRCPRTRPRCPSPAGRIACGSLSAAVLHRGIHHLGRLLEDVKCAIEHGVKAAHGYRARSPAYGASGRSAEAKYPVSIWVWLSTAPGAHPVSADESFGGVAKSSAPQTGSAGLRPVGSGDHAGLGEFGSAL